MTDTPRSRAAQVTTLGKPWEVALSECRKVSEELERELADLKAQHYEDRLSISRVVNGMNQALDAMTERAEAAEKVCKAADGWDTVIDKFGDTTNHNLACHDINEALKAWREAEGKA